MTARRISVIAALSIEIVTDGLVPRHLHQWELDGPDYEGYDHARCTFAWLIPPGPRGKRPRERTCNEYKDIREIEAALDEREALMVISGPLSKEKWAFARRNVKG